MKVYRYLTGKDDVNFCARITEALNHGYELYGSPSMTFNGSDVIVGQVIVTDVATEEAMPVGLRAAILRLRENNSKKAK